ncbi:MAG: hypothetical protein RJB37_1486, partial [Pseudomonadota bacterium]
MHNMLETKMNKLVFARSLLGGAAMVAMSLLAQAQTAYVSSEKDHTLTVIDLKTQAVTGTVATC